MKNYNNFILEKLVNKEPLSVVYEAYKKSNYFGNELTTEEFHLLYAKNCKNHKKQNLNLYRGVQTKYYSDLYINPKGNIRHSIENENIHVILMSEMESWKDFPKYNQSIIGSTNIIDADAYNKHGTLFEIIPFDNTKIGVCSHQNIWESYGGYHSSYNIIRIVQGFILDFTKLNDEEKIKSWKQIKKEILKIKNIYERYNNESINNNMRSFFKTMLYRKEHGIFGYDYDNYKFFEKFMEIVQPTPEKIIEHIEWLFDPKRSGFNYMKYDIDFSKNMNKFFDYYNENLQVWCEGPALLKIIDDEYFEMFSKSLK